MAKSLKNLKHTDSSFKYGFMVLGETLHRYFELESEYAKLYPTEIITPDGENKRMDILYSRKDGVLNNIEIQTTPTDEEKLKVIGEYREFAEKYYHKSVTTIIITTVEIEKCEDGIFVGETLILSPKYIHIPVEECEEKLENLRQKINNKEKLDEKESLDLAILPILFPKELSEQRTEEICYLIRDDENIKHELKRDICFMVKIMLYRNITDDEKIEKLLKVIDMDAYESPMDVIKRDARNEGKKLERKEIAKNLKKEKINPKVIARWTGLTINEINKL